MDELILTFEDWCNITRYPGFYEQALSLSDIQFFELEDEYKIYVESKKSKIETCE